MRVIEPRINRNPTAVVKSGVRKGVLIFGLMVMVAGVIATGVSMFRPDHTVKEMSQSQGVVMAISTQQPPKTKPIIFEGNDFKDVYRKAIVAYPNTQEFPQVPIISGDAAADSVIRQVAEARGFQVTRIPVTALSKTGEATLSGDTDDLLQPLALQGWQNLKAAAKKNGIQLQLLSAYRSPEWQRNLFLQRLAGNGANAAQLAAGGGVPALNQTLGVTSIPGYSRHHTGYTVDFSCSGVSVFRGSSCDMWLRKDNYLQAKTYGWIPSYPDGADEQGPEPEPWEYVWVGRDYLFE